MIQRPKPQQFTATIEKKEQLTSRVILMTFKLENPQELHFQAGQTFMLNVAEGINRTMSIASPPEEKNKILMCHDVSPGGPGSQWTIAHNVGDTATFMAPLGMFVMRKESHRKKILVATGTGMAPFRSMLLDYLDNGGTDDVTVYWGLRYEEDVYWLSELQALSVKYPNFRLVLTLSKPSDAWQGDRGRVTSHVIEKEHNLAGSDFYLCGNQLMIKDIETQLASHQVPRNQIYKELYF